MSMPLSSARLWIVATPIGNPGDLAPRAREILTQCELALAEDTRRAAALFTACGLPQRKFTSFFEHNEAQRQREVLAALAGGKHVALISDAGTPLIADPGYRLVQACREMGYPVSPVPGPCAPIAALSAAGIAPLPFTFLGFLPRSAGERESLFLSCRNCPGSLTFFERKDRLAASLAIAKACLDNRLFAICRELTKPHEEFIIGRLEDAATLASNLKGEITVIIAPAEKEVRAAREIVEAAIKTEISKGRKKRAAALAVSSLCTGWSSSEIYSLMTEMATQNGD